MRLAQQLTADEKKALRDFANQQGPRWKTRLRHMWMYADYSGSATNSRVLQCLRNASYFGPEGLIKVRPADYQ